MDTWLKRIGLGVLVLAILGAVAVFAIDAHVQTTAGPRIVTAMRRPSSATLIAVLVLGCGVHPDGCPSDMLADRIAQGVALYENGHVAEAADVGDHGRADYDEVNAMREMAVQAGLPADDVFMDHAGFFHLREHVPGRAMCSGRSASCRFPEIPSVPCALRGGTSRAGRLTECPPICVHTPGRRPASARSAGPKQGLLHSDRAAAPDVSGRPHLAFRQRQRHRGLRWQGREHATWRCAVMVEAFEFSSYGPTRVVAKATLHTI